MHREFDFIPFTLESSLETTQPGLELSKTGNRAQMSDRLIYESRKAVGELAAKGILTYCLTLDANADSYVKRIFGANNYTIVDHVDRLPEKLPALFASLTS